MELRNYFDIIWRRWWAVLIPIVVVVALGLTRPAPPPVYTLTVGLLVDVPSLPADAQLTIDPRWTAPQAAEYLVDDLSVVVRGSEFARQLARHRQERLPAWAPAARFDHYYRLALNTRPALAVQRELTVGDELTIL